MTKYRVQILKLMDEDVRDYDSEEGLDYWLTYGVPDEAPEDVLEDIAKDDGAFESIVEAYNYFLHNYAS